MKQNTSCLYSILESGLRRAKWVSVFKETSRKSHTILCTLLSRALSYALIYLKERLRNWVLIMINHGFITNRVITEFTVELAYIDGEIGYYKELSWNNIFNRTRFKQTGIYAHLSYKVEKKECSGWKLLNTECSPRIIWRENVKGMGHDTLIRDLNRAFFKMLT